MLFISFGGIRPGAGGQVKTRDEENQVVLNSLAYTPVLDNGFDFNFALLMCFTFFPVSTFKIHLSLVSLIIC